MFQKIYYALVLVGWLGFSVCVGQETGSAFNTTLEKGILVTGKREPMAGGKYVWIIEILDPKKQNVIYNVSLIIRGVDAENVCCVRFSPEERDFGSIRNLSIYKIEISEDYLKESSLGIDLKNGSEAFDVINLNFKLNNILDE